MALKIVTDWYNPYPASTEFYKHKLDEKRIEFFFTRNGQPFDLWLGQSGHPTEHEAYEVVGAVTINNKIIAEELTPIQTSDPDLGTGISLDLKDYKLFAGLMKVEFKFTDVNNSTNNVTYPISPIKINITPSILDNASATPESVGSVADMLRLYPTLNSIVNDGVQTSYIADNAITTAKIADSSVTTAKIATSAVTTPKIADEAVSYGKLSTALQDVIDVVPDTPMYIDLIGTLTAADAFDSGDYCNLGGVFQFTASGALATAIGVTADSDCELRYVNGYQLVTQTDTQQIFIREITRVAPSFQAGSWSEVIHPAITSLQNTVGTLNTQLENALNGGA